MSSAYGIFKNTTQPISSSDIPEIATDEKKKIANARKEHLHEIMRKKSWLWELVMGDRMKIRKSRHDIAMCIALTGTSPRARSATCYESCNVEGGIGESIHLELEWPDGMIADIRLSNISVRRRRFTVFFEGGVLVYDDMAYNKLVIHPAQHFEEQPRGLGRALPFANWFPLTRAVASFVGSIKSKAISHDSLALGVDVTRVLAECECLVKL